MRVLLLLVDVIHGYRLMEIHAWLDWQGPHPSRQVERLNLLELRVATAYVAY